MKKAIKLLIAEEQPLIRAGLQHLFGSSKKFTIIAQATTLLQTFRLCQQLEPDILVLSLNLLPLPIQPTINDLREYYPNVQLLLLGGDCDHNCLRDLLNAGIAGYILKSDPTEAVNAAIYAIANGGSYFSHAVLTSLDQVLDSHEVPKETQPLTKRELQIVNLLLRGLDNRMIASELGLAHQTIRNRLSMIYKKLGVQSRAEAIVRVNQQENVGI